MSRLTLPHGEVELPAFFPDGTYGAVKSAGWDDIESCGISGVVMNAFHLYSKPGLSIIRKSGGINSFSGFKKPVLTDSGGFQVFSLLRENSKNGQIRENEIIIRPGQNDDKIIYTPRKCIQMQFALRSDIIMCLDYCTHPDDPREIQQRSVDTTVRWAKICREEYELQCANYKYTSSNRPLIFAIIQGGADRELRRRCAEELIAIGFDGFGFGGWPADSRGMAYDILEYTASLMPDRGIKYAMGVGRPEEIVKCASFGYGLFDCVIPTREARHKRLYAFNAACENEINVFNEGFYSFVYIDDDKYAQDQRPVSEACGCPCCQSCSRAYLRHLFRLNEPTAKRFATIHNLYFYSTLMKKLRQTK